MVSYKILPKILSMFPHTANANDAPKLLQWAYRDLDLINCFFQNLKEFIETYFKSNDIENEDLHAELEHEIQGRLDFLTAMYSNDITPDHCSMYYFKTFFISLFIKGLMLFNNRRNTHSKKNKKQFFQLVSWCINNDFL